jgi:multiple sugar transport system ATP-binding protein
MTMGDRITVMKDGVIQQVDTPINLYDFPSNKFVASFIGTPPMNFFYGEVRESAEGYIFHGETVEVLLRNEWKEIAEKYVGKKIIFGARPEDIGSEIAEANPNSPTLKAKVEVIEPMGSETFLYLDTGTQSFISRIDAHRKAEVGQEIELKIFMEKAHLFDAETEKLLV